MNAMTAACPNNQIDGVGIKIVPIWTRSNAPHITQSALSCLLIYKKFAIAILYNKTTTIINITIKIL